MITIDFEMVPGPWWPRPTPDTIKVPGNIKKPESIEAYRNDPVNLENAWRARSLSPFYGMIVCATASCFTVDENGDLDSDIESVQFYESNNEKLLLDGLNDWRRECQSKSRHTWVAHNGFDFDFFFGAFRAAVHDIPDLARDLRSPRWGDRYHRDTMVIGGPRYISLEDLCNAFNIPHASTSGGSQVYDWWSTNRHDLVKSHGRDDGIALNMLAMRLVRCGLLEIHR